MASILYFLINECAVPATLCLSNSAFNEASTALLSVNGNPGGLFTFLFINNQKHLGHSKKSSRLERESLVRLGINSFSTLNRHTARYRFRHLMINSLM